MGWGPGWGPGTQRVQDEHILLLCRVLGHGLDLDEVPPPPAVKAPTLPSTETYLTHGRTSCPLVPRSFWGSVPVNPDMMVNPAMLVTSCCHPVIPPHPPADGDFGEPRGQKGLDRYLDSLFDPVLSYGNGVRGVSPRQPCILGVQVSWLPSADTCAPGAGEADCRHTENEGRRRRRRRG